MAKWKEGYILPMEVVEGKTRISELKRRCCASLPKGFGDEARVHRLVLWKEDSAEHGFTDQCAGC